MTRLRSRMVTAPSTLIEPSGWRRTPGIAGSCSSVMSPTISSRMSSSVTRPSTTPYSSTTSANGVLRRRNALSCSDTGRVSGTNQAGRISAATSSLEASPSTACSARSRSLTCRTPMMFSGLPLWRGNPENIIGVLHVKDLLRALDAVEGDASKLDIAALMRPAWFVPDTRPVSEQLKAFRRRKTPFALVVDEYGEVEGLVTLEDILEEIVGDITDEHDVAVPGVRRQPDGSVNVDGAVPIRDLNRVMDWNLPDEEATTIAGLVIHEARSIPDVGQSFTFHGFRFRVLRKNRNRITALRIQPLPRKAAAKAG